MGGRKDKINQPGDEILKSRGIGWGMVVKNFRYGLEIGEYVAIAGAIAGSVWASISGEILYAAAPISLALVLSLMDRRLLRRESRQNINRAMMQMQKDSGISMGEQQDLTQELEQVLAALRQVRSQQKSVEQALVPMKNQVEALSQEFRTRPELEQIESLTAVITALQQCIDGLPSPGGMQAQIGELEGQIVQAIARIPSIVEVEVQQQLEKQSPDGSS